MFRTEYLRLLCSDGRLSLMGLAGVSICCNEIYSSVEWINNFLGEAIQFRKFLLWFYHNGLCESCLWVCMCVLEGQTITTSQAPNEDLVRWNDEMTLRMYFANQNNHHSSSINLYESLYFEIQFPSPSFYRNMKIVRGWAKIITFSWTVLMVDVACWGFTVYLKHIPNTTAGGIYIYT